MSEFLKPCSRLLLAHEQGFTKWCSVVWETRHALHAGSSSFRPFPSMVGTRAPSMQGTNASADASHDRYRYGKSTLWPLRS
jgi:hypothetical protein